jgi:hypothetical protein
MSLISQPGSDYQLAQLTLDAGTARDIMLMLPGRLRLIPPRLPVRQA